MLYLEEKNTFTPWTHGSPFPDGSRCSADIESLWSDEELAEKNLYRPAGADPVPDGKIIVSTSVERVEGAVKFVHIFDDILFEDLKQNKIELINTKVSEILSSGFTVPFGAMSGKILQTRDLNDRTNWLVSQASYSAAIAGGFGSVEAAEFRTSDNETFTVSYSDGLNILLAMASWGAMNMKNSWTLKDSIKSAQDEQELDLIDIEIGWS